MIVLTHQHEGESLSSAAKINALSTRDALWRSELWVAKKQDESCCKKDCKKCEIIATEIIPGQRSIIPPNLLERIPTSNQEMWQPNQTENTEQEKKTYVIIVMHQRGRRPLYSVAKIKALDGTDALWRSELWVAQQQRKSGCKERNKKCEVSVTEIRADRSSSGTLAKMKTIPTWEL